MKRIFRGIHSFLTSNMFIITLTSDEENEFQHELNQFLLRINSILAPPIFLAVLLLTVFSDPVNFRQFSGHMLYGRVFGLTLIFLTMVFSYLPRLRRYVRFSSFIFCLAGMGQLAHLAAVTDNHWSVVMFWIVLILCYGVYPIRFRSLIVLYALSYAYYILLTFYFDDSRTFGFFIAIVNAAQATIFSFGFKYVFLRIKAKEFLTHKNLKSAHGEISSLYQTLALRNKTIEDELDIARQIQHRVVPSTLSLVEDYKLFAYYAPMDKVGGDFYDHRRRDEWIDLIIADVAGHGLSSAFISLIVKISFEEAVNQKLSPPAVLAFLNNAVNQYTVHHKYVTAFYGIVNTKTKHIRYSNAGHIHPLIYRKTGSAILELQSKNLPLGLKPNIDYEEHEFQLIPGDRLVLYTDGIIECRDRTGELFGELRFHEFIKQHNNLPSDKLVTALLKKMCDFSGTCSLDDDVTIMLLDMPLE